MSMDEDLVRITQLARAVCFSLPSDRLGVVLDPFDHSGSTDPGPHGWRAKLVLYSDQAHTSVLETLAVNVSELDWRRKDSKWGPDAALAGLRRKIEGYMRGETYP